MFTYRSKQQNQNSTQFCGASNHRQTDILQEDIADTPHVLFSVIGRGCNFLLCVGHVDALSYARTRVCNRTGPAKQMCCKNKTKYYE